MKKNQYLLAGILLLMGFAAWTLLIQTVDVQSIGPNESSVGFAALNGWFHQVTGVHWTLYTLTDWLGLVPIGVCLIFAGAGLVQLVQRRSLFKVDLDILLLGVYLILKKAVPVICIALAAPLVLSSCSRTVSSSDAAAPASSTAQEQVSPAESDESAGSAASSDESWKTDFEKSLWENYNVTPEYYEDLGDGIYQVYVKIDGKTVPYVCVDSATGDYHG